MFIMNYESKLALFLMSSLLEHDLSLLFNFRLRTIKFYYVKHYKHGEGKNAALTAVNLAVASLHSSFPLRI